LVIIPIGIFFAAFGKRLGMLWFRIHVFVQAFGIVVISCAFIVIIERMGEFVASTGQTHFRVAHGRLGLAIFIIAIIQPFLGALADALFNPDRKFPGIPDIIHRVFGYGLIILATVNIYLGLARYAYNTGASIETVIYVLFSIWVGFIGVTYAAFAILKLVLPADINYLDGHKKSEGTEMKSAA